jgi:hypothetical protein
VVTAHVRLPLNPMLIRWPKVKQARPADSQRRPRASSIERGTAIMGGLLILIPGSICLGASPNRYV